MLNRSAAWVAGAAVALVIAPACTEKGRSLILVDVQADTTLVDLKKVTIEALQGNKPVGSSTFEWISGGVNKLSVRVAKDVTGAVTVAAEGVNATGGRIAMSAAVAASVQPGIVSDPPVTLHLVPLVVTPGTGGSAGGSSGSGGGGGGVGGIGTGGVGVGGGGGLGGLGATGTGGVGLGGAPGSSWRGPNMVEADVLFDDWTPAIAVDAMGNAVVAYRHGPNIKASRHTAAGWAPPVLIDGRTGGQAYSPAVAVDRNGRWLVIWQQDDGEMFPGIWQSTSTDGVAWSAPSAISTGATFGPELAMNRDGAAVAAWSARTTAGSIVIAASVRTPATGTWSTPVEMRPSTATSSLIQRVAMSGTGEAFVVWDDYDDRSTGYQNSIWLRRFSANTWRPAALVETYDTGATDSADVAANGAGQAIVTWRQIGAANEVWASTFSAAGVQSPPSLVAQAPAITWEPAPSVTLDETGVATIAWAMQVQGRYNVYTSRAAAGQPWPAAMAMETDNQAASVTGGQLDQTQPAPIVRADAAGNVFVVWRKRVGTTRFDLWGRRFSGGTWAPATLLETDDAAVGGVSFPALGVGANGGAATAWYYRVADTDPTTNRIWANVWR